MSEKHYFLARYGSREHALDAIHNSDDHDIIAKGLMNHHIKMHEVRALCSGSFPENDPKQEKIWRMARYVNSQMSIGNLPKKNDE